MHILVKEVLQATYFYFVGTRGQINYCHLLSQILQMSIQCFYLHQYHIVDRRYELLILLTNLSLNSQLHFVVFELLVFQQILLQFLHCQDLLFHLLVVSLNQRICLLDALLGLIILVKLYFLSRLFLHLLKGSLDITAQFDDHTFEIFALRANSVMKKSLCLLHRVEGLAIYIIIDFSLEQFAWFFGCVFVAIQ